MRKVVQWNCEEDEMLRRALQEFGPKNWLNVSKIVGTRDNHQCASRWRKTLLQRSNQIKWTEDENRIISEWKQPNGSYDFSNLQKLIQDKTIEDVRDRWLVFICIQDNSNSKWRKKELLKFNRLFKEYGANVDAYIKYFPDKNIDIIKSKIADYLDDQLCVQSQPENEEFYNHDMFQDNKDQNDNLDAFECKSLTFAISSLENEKECDNITTVISDNQTPSQILKISRRKSIDEKDEKLKKIEFADLSNILNISKPNRVFGAWRKRRLIKTLRKNATASIEPIVSKTDYPIKNNISKLTNIERKKWVYYMNRRFL